MSEIANENIKKKIAFLASTGLNIKSKMESIYLRIYKKINNNFYSLYIHLTVELIFDV